MLRFAASRLHAPPVVNAVEKFKQLVDVVSRRHFSHPEFSAFGDEVDKDVAEVRFGDGLILIHKAPASPTWTESEGAISTTGRSG